MIRWGILGAGNIAHRFARSLAATENGELYAVANRTLEKAHAFQKEHPCEKIYDDYEELLQDKNVDIVYIALPHLYHFKWIKRAIVHHKAVLCEKPATLNLSEMLEINKLVQEKQLFFMEAMKSRFVPAYQKMSSMIKSGVIGKITNISTSLCRLVPEKNSSYYYDPIQGGCLLDMGIYNASLIEDFIKEPLTVQQVDYKIHTNGVETYINAILSNDQVTCQLESGFDRTLPVEAVITGTKGKITMPDFHRGSRMIVCLNQREDESATYEYEIPYRQDDFYGEIEHVMDCFSKGLVESEVMPLQSSLNCAEMIEKIKKKLIP